MTDLPFPANATFLSVKEVAALFRVCPKTVRRWIQSGELPATRLGRDWRIARNNLKAHAAAHGNQVLGHVL
ncbi:helix-turn-helix domain-containing protein [Ruegeria marina]|uniref:DNA binding domain-containing protein, excisionase family n=1 Tax=Ruegeria marina TaxID=639004 RepID=A0A1G7FYI4_9RHOB|nr:helix-turn-helix domain-containing protein [Ruegeria marina]SDE80842.1 DNA binding domain-containing protein, excisionase family [Ruegeria marina]